MIKAIIFDWTEVIATDGLGVWLQKNFLDFDIGKDHLDDLVNSGKISHEEFMQILSEKTNVASADIWEGIKKESIVNLDLVNTIIKLKKNYKIGLLSNFTAPWLREIITINNLWYLFDEYIISSDYKMLKPNRDIFEKMLEMFKIDTSEAIFVDDRQINIDGAEKIGIKSILFKKNEQFIKDLQKLGINI